MDNIIEVTSLSKAYGEIKAVKGISFYVETGKLFAFLGPNGAGKSTTIDTICTFLKPDGGKVIVDGHELGKEDDEIRSVIGAVFQDGLLDSLLTIKENLEVRGRFYGLRGAALQAAVKKTAELTGVTELLKRPYGKLSGGQRRRCDIARALIHTPKILFLDEPTTGLDPQTRKNVWDTIQMLQKQTNMTIFLTTHYMEEASDADFVIVIDNGEIAAKGTPMKLREEYASDKLRLVCKEKMDIVTGLLDEKNITYDLIADSIIIKLANTLQSLDIIDMCRQYLIGLEVTSGTMDDAFIKITGRAIRE